MTLVASPVLAIPNTNQFAGTITPPAFSASLMDASTEKVAILFRAPKTGTLNRVKFRFGTVARDATTVLRVSFQDIDLTTGDPDGVVDQYRLITAADIVSDTVVTSGIISSDGTDTGTKRSVTKSDLIYLVIEYSTFVALDAININSINEGVRGAPFNREYVNIFLVSWIPSTSISPLLSIEYDDGTYSGGTNVRPAFSAKNSHSIDNATTPNVVGLKFRFPYPCKIGGAWVNIDEDGDYDLKLFTAAGSTTLLSLDLNNRASTTNMNANVHFADQELAANTDYILAAVPTSLTNIIVYSVGVGVAAELEQLPSGQNFHYAEASSPTTTADFTATTTRLPLMGVLVTALDDGASAGGESSSVFG